MGGEVPPSMHPRRMDSLDSNLYIGGAWGGGEDPPDASILPELPEGESPFSRWALISIIMTFAESREQRPPCKKADFRIVCTGGSPLHAPPSNGLSSFESLHWGCRGAIACLTHASSEGPRRVSLLSRIGLSDQSL